MRHERENCEEKGAGRKRVRGKCGRKVQNKRRRRREERRALSRMGIEEEGGKEKCVQLETRREE